MSVIGSTIGGQVVWSLASQFEVAEGALLVATSSFVLVAAERLGLASRLDLHLRKHVEPPISHAFTLLAVLGALCFDVLAICNFKAVNRVVDVNGLNLVQYPLRAFGYLGGDAMGPGGRLGYGALALAAWAFTVVFLTLGAGAKRAVKLFAVPSILFLTVVVLLFDPGQMDIQAVNLVSGVTFNGVSLLSNWSLMVVSLCFTVLSLARAKPGRKLGELTRSAKAAAFVRSASSWASLRSKGRAARAHGGAKDGRSARPKGSAGKERQRPLARGSGPSSERPGAPVELTGQD